MRRKVIGPVELWTLDIPLYPSGRRVWCCIYAGRWWLHVEVHRFVLDVYGPEQRKQQRRQAKAAPWQPSWRRWTPTGQARIKAEVAKLRQRDGLA